jgi:hypothetical protein
MQCADPPDRPVCAPLCPQVASALTLLTEEPLVIVLSASVSHVIAGLLHTEIGR